MLTSECSSWQVLSFTASSSSLSSGIFVFASAKAYIAFFLIRSFFSSACSSWREKSLFCQQRFLKWFIVINYLNIYWDSILCWSVMSKNENNKCHHKKAIGTNIAYLKRTEVILQKMRGKNLIDNKNQISLSTGG